VMDRSSGAEMACACMPRGSAARPSCHRLRKRSGGLRATGRRQEPLGVPGQRVRLDRWRPFTWGFGSLHLRCFKRGPASVRWRRGWHC
jgi:hypothetical protein